MRARIFVLAAFAALLAAPPVTAQPLETFDAGVNSPLSIWLRDGTSDVVHLQQSGLYRFEVLDNTNDHNFRLSGAGITEQRTEIFTNASPVRHIWDVVLPPGLYHYNCEHHAQMFGDFTVGDVIWVEATGLGNGTVRSTAGAVDWPKNRGAAFEPGTEVTLTATANAGSKFLGWSGGTCTGTEPCTVTVNGRVNVVAQFTPAVGTGGGGATAPASLTRLTVLKTKQGRFVQARLTVRRQTDVTAQLRKQARIVASKAARLAPGTRTVKLAVPRKAKAGSYTLRLILRDVASGDRFTVNRTVRIPR